VSIWISGFRRRFSAELLLFPAKIVVSVMQSLLLLRRKRPDVVMGTGGYVCGPVVFAAQLLHRPTLIQEQNSYPGITTRLLAPGASEVHLTFEQSRGYLRTQENVHLTGNPTRHVMGSVERSDAARFFGIDPARKTILIFGGSQGASSINAAMASVVPALVREGVQVLWQTGSKDCAALRVRFEAVQHMVRVFEFIDRMEMAYAACDLVICRSGATSLAEITCVGLPSVLVPYPFAAADHQTENARAMVAAGAAVLVSDARAATELPPVVRNLIHDPLQLKAMAEAARRMGKPEAASVLADAVLRLAYRKCV
jgi:UDP-N-acetylglucosamine--N-acetylmuramyl-(pentapeptide) pyrophosphoryl-undecaprenol N-acetylglucosamine transferase